MEDIREYIDELYNKKTYELESLQRQLNALKNMDLSFDALSSDVTTKECEDEAQCIHHWLDVLFGEDYEEYNDLRDKISDTLSWYDKENEDSEED